MAEGGTAKGMSPDDINLGTFGHHHFRADQKNIITEALESRDIMVIMPTGGGKSLCYQIPAMRPRPCGRGYTALVPGAGPSIIVEEQGDPRQVSQLVPGRRGNPGAFQHIPLR